MPQEVAVFVLEVLVAVAVLVGLVFVVTLRLSGLEDESDDAADVGLPSERMLRSDDVPRLRFRVALRGYRMSDVDEAMEAVQAALRAAETRATETRPARTDEGRPAHPSRWSRPAGRSDADLAEQPATEVETQALSTLESMGPPDVPRDPAS
jgi:DivIVA domain-containing protein